MNPPCNREWTRQFIAKSFSDVFLNKKLKKKREEILFDIERSLLPATQPIVEQILRREKNPKEYNEVCNQIEDLEMEIRFLDYEINSGKNYMHYFPDKNFKCNIPKDDPLYWRALEKWQQDQKAQTDTDIIRKQKNFKDFKEEKKKNTIK
jgi:hypothetical protein